jgi:branched-chain amino acid aminotransferase
MPTDGTYADWAWLDGEFVPWEECRIHARCQAVLVGAAVFEGIRAYWNEDQEQAYMFRFADHEHRLRESMKVTRMASPMPDGLETICAELIARNGWRADVHFTPFAYMGVAPDGGFLSANPNEGFFITALVRPRSRAVESGAHVRVSSFTRISDAVMPPRIKATANYQNSRLAMMEARADGYDNALLLNPRGTLSEAADACVAVIRRGRLATPPVTSGILESVTRATVMQLAQEDLGMTVEEREVDRTELYVADEVLLCATGAEVTPVASVDRVTVGAGRPGAVTRELQARYFAIARGQVEDHPEWRSPVYRRAEATGAARAAAQPTRPVV